MGRKPCCAKVGLKRGPWSIEEDQKLSNFILNNGIHCWRHVPMLAGLLRCGKSCRLRWLNYLRPDLKRGDFTDMEENRIIQLHACLGNKWSQISAHFPGRTDNEIKNHWNTRIKKKLKLLGIDPLTHKPIEEHVTASEFSPMKRSLQEGLEVKSASSDEKKLKEAFSSLEDNITEESMKMERLQEIFEPMPIDCPNTGRKEERLSLISSSLDDTIDFINSYEFRCGGFQFGSSADISQENNTGYILP